MRTLQPRSVTLTRDLDARVDAAAEAVLDVPKSRIHRRALDAYFAGLPQDQRDAIQARVSAIQVAA